MNEVLAEVGKKKKVLEAGKMQQDTENMKGRCGRRGTGHRRGQQAQYERQQVVYRRQQAQYRR